MVIVNQDKNVDIIKTTLIYKAQTIDISGNAPMISTYLLGGFWGVLHSQELLSTCCYNMRLTKIPCLSVIC